MGSFWEDREEEYNRKREGYYIDDPTQIAWRSIAIGVFLFLLFFIYCPTSANEYVEIRERDKVCKDNFFSYSFNGIVKGKEYIQAKRTNFMTIQSLDSNKSERVNCRCDDLYEIYKAVEIGDTILKPADTLLVKIYNSPKYEELNRYETYRKK